MESGQSKHLFLKLVAGLTIAVGAGVKAQAITVSIEERVLAIRAAEEAKARLLKKDLLHGPSPSQPELNPSLSDPEIHLLQWGNWGNWGNWNNWNNWANWNNWVNWGKY